MNHLAYDVVVTGAGPGGLMAALHSSMAGKRTLVLEKRSVPADRDPGQERFQAVIVDKQTLINLKNVGMEITPEHFFPIEQALFQTQTDAPPMVLPYHLMPENLTGNSSSNLNLLAFRRNIVALTSIGHIEAGLTRLAEADTNIEILYEQQPEKVTLKRFHIDLALNNKIIRTGCLAIADGANSDLSGTMRLIGVRKNRTPSPVNIAISRFSDASRRGDLFIREMPGDEHRHSALFGLKDEVVVYTDFNGTTGDDLDQHMAGIAGKLNIKGGIIARPRLIKQQSSYASNLVIDGRVFLLGDAALSGTAILGVYLNKAIFDGVAFGQTLRSGIVSHYQKRATSIAMRELIVEEQIISRTLASASSLSRPRINKELVAAIPRCLFRLKAGRHSLTRTLAANLADTLASFNDGLATSLPSETLRRTSRQSAQVWRSINRTLDDTTS